MSNWKIYLIHHSHTDIGYTERQEKMKVYHKDFVLQALDILDEIHAGKLTGSEGFVWQCENQWQVENFYALAKATDIERFEQYVQSGEIGLSGVYLNMTELVDADTMHSRTLKAKNYGDKLGVPIKSGMSADVNGYAWGYPDILSKCGVENLFSALHSHHGMYPMGQNQVPFYWKGPEGGKVLVWLSEHYHLGNEFYLCPNGGTTYVVKDELGGSSPYTKEENDKQELYIAETRIRRYVEQLEKDGYPYNFFPVMVSGVISDNGPPNSAIANRVNELNDIFSDKLTIEMATLDIFFEQVRLAEVEIPTYEGDWPDWWADGTGSTPNTLKLFREAQRKLNLAMKLDTEGNLGDPELTERASENVMMYAEHTWGYSSSISEPWDSMVASLEKKKDAYAINANTEASQNLDGVLAALGEVSIQPQRNQRYKVVNPHSVPYHGVAKLYLEFWEYLDGVKLQPSGILHAVEESSGEQLPCQYRQIARAHEIDVIINLEPGESKIIKLKQELPARGTAARSTNAGSEGIPDIVKPGRYMESPMQIETDFFKVTFSQNKGNAHILDKQSGRIITDDVTGEGAFTGVYEFTPSKDKIPTAVRTKMGRNRSAISTQRSVAELSDITIEDSGPVSVTAKLTYILPGTQFYLVYLKVHKQLPLIEARVCLHKDSVWEPENLYVALPFKGDEQVEMTIDKTGCLVRPGIDQLPGTGVDFSLLRNGIYNKGENVDVVISTLDAPLVVFGERGPKPIELFDQPNVTLNNGPVYSWVMNNFWETNFAADLGGFYEFRYSISTGKFDSAEEALHWSEVMNEGVLGFPI